MTRRTFTLAFIAVVIAYVALVALAFVIRGVWYDDPRGTSWQYATYKDVLPLLVAIPAAWLAFSVQRRMSYLQQLRLIWSKLVEAVQSALEYTDLESPEASDQQKTLRTIRIVIDEIRALFKNVGETDRRRGVYPFGEVKNIHDLVRDLSPTSFTPTAAAKTRAEILSHWKQAQRFLLPEFDREEPASHRPISLPRP